MAGTSAPSATIEVRPSEGSRDPERDRFVLAHPLGTVFHLSGWRRAVERVHGHAACDLLAAPAGGDPKHRIAGLLPLMHCARPLGAILGRGDLVSVPYGVYGGPIGESPEVVRALVEAALALGKRERVGRVELRCVGDPGSGRDLGGGLEGWTRSELYATFVRDLPSDAAEVMKRMPKRARAEVRHAVEKHGLELDEGERYLADLARLFGESKQRLGSPGLSRAWFEVLAAELGERAVCHAAVRRGEVVAATMSFLFRDTLVFYYIGTTAEGNRVFNATNFLTTRLQEWGVGRGLSRFDLSRSRLGSGSFRFKEHQGFVPTPLAYRYALIGSHGLPTLTPSNPRTKILRRTWARLPGWLARSLSGRLSRYLP